MDREETAKIRRGSKGVMMVGQFFTEGKRATRSLFSSSKTSGQVSIDWTGKKKK